MASALMNMMMDEDKKKQGAPAGPPSKTPAPSSPPTPQMPASQSAVTPAQQGAGGAGAQPPTQGTSTQQAAQQLLGLLKGGRGPVNPATQKPLPEYDWRSDAGSQLPAYTEYEGTYEVNPVSGFREFKPTLDAQGNKIVKRKGRDLVLQEQEAAGMPINEDAQTRIRDVRVTNSGLSPTTSADDLMAGARADADLQRAYEAGEITQADLNRDLGASTRANLSQGFTTQAPPTMSDAEARYQQIKGLRVEDDPLSLGPKNVSATRRVDELIRSTIRKGSGSNNPFTLIQATKSQLDREAALLRQRGIGLQKGLIGEIASLGIDAASQPEFQRIAATSYGKPLDQVLMEYQRTYGKPLLSAANVKLIKDAVAKKSSEFLSDASAITSSTGYKILDTTLKSKSELGLNSGAADRLAKAGLGYLTAVGRTDEYDLDTARSYFNMAISGDPTMEMYRDGIESQLSEDPDLGYMFKRGAEGTIAKSNQRAQGLNSALAEVVKHSLDTVSNDMVRGAEGSRTARQATVRLMNRFIMPFYDGFQNGSVAGFAALEKTPWGRAFIRPLQASMSVTDTQNMFSQIIDFAGAPDDPSRKPLLDAISAPFGIKRALRELFTFDTAGKEEAFDSIQNDLNSALDAGDNRKAAELLAPFSDTDQLRTLFGAKNVEGINGQGKPRNVLPLGIEDITGAGGSRRQAIDAYLAQRGAFNRAADKFDNSTLKLRGPSLVARLAGQYKADAGILGLTTRDNQNEYQIGFVAEAGDDQKIATVVSDIEKYLSPSITSGPDKKSADPLFDETLRSVDDAISKLRFNLDNDRLPPEKVAGSQALLESLEGVRERALGNVDDVVRAGAGRHLLFRMTEDGPDYSEPIRATGSASKVSQFVDMLYASVTNTPGVNINRYFKGAAGTSTTTKIGSVLVVPVDTRGRPVPNMQPVAVKPDSKGNLRVPVFELVDGKYQRALDPFGNNRFTTQTQASAEQARAGLLQRAVNDTGRGDSVDARYIRSQVHEVTRHLEKIIYADAQSLGGAETQERINWLREKTGISPEIDSQGNTTGRILNTDVEKFLQSANKVQQRDLLTFLDMYGQSDVLRPNPRVNWTMNASNSRGQSAGTEGIALSGLEREAGNTVLEQKRTTMFTLSTTAKQTIRNMADQFMDAGVGLMDDQQKAFAADKIMKGLITSVPEVGADNTETALIRDGLRDYIDAVLSDDVKAQQQASSKLSRTISSFQPTQEEIDTQVRENIKTPAMNIVRPIEEADKPSTQEILARARSKSAEESKARRAAARYFYTAFFPDMGWMTATGPEQLVKDFMSLEKRMKQRGTVRGVNIEKSIAGLDVKPANKREIDIANKNRGTRIASGGEKINRRPMPQGERTNVPQQNKPLPLAGLYQPNKPKSKFKFNKTLGMIGGVGVTGATMSGRNR